MKYESQIDAAFERLKFTPRIGQKEAVDQILTAFVDEGMQNVILNASTGTGKSIIGAVAADTLSAIKGSGDTRSSISLTATNVLSAQYATTFEQMGDKKYIMIKGANNYNCSALTTDEEEVNAESCAWFTMVKSGSEFDGIINQHCNQCNYLKVKGLKNTVKHLTTNYSYFFVDRMYTGKFEDRDLIIWDEAHLINDLFSEHNAIHFSKKRMQQMAQEIADTVQLTDLEISKSITTIAADCGKPGKINEQNYSTYLTALTKIYEYAAQKGAALAERALRSNKMNQYTKANKFTKKFEGLACKISDLITYNYEHVFDYKEEDSSITIKPVFVGSMTEALQCGKHNLFMSATISSSFMVQTLNLDEAKTKFIKLAPSFPKENKEVVFFDPLSLSYTSLQNPVTVSTLRKNVVKVVKKHIQDGDRGIILTPSFKLQAELVSEIMPLVKAGKMKLFEHVQGTKLEQTLVAFKEYKSELPAVLISPSIFEGVDLPGNLSRFQILVKAPFPSLGDKRMKFILDRHPDLYNTITVMKAVQGAGRSVRSKEDHAVTYCMDLNLQRLWTGNHNIWKDEFTTRFTKFL